MPDINLSKPLDLSKMPLGTLKNLLPVVKEKPARQMIRTVIGRKRREHASRLVAAKKKRNHKK